MSEVKNLSEVVEEVITKLCEESEREYFSRYKVAQIINYILRDHELKTIKEQMIYNYCRNDMIQTVEVNSKLMINYEELVRFSVKYLSKKIK